MTDLKTVQLPLGGMYSAGDPALIPEKATRLMENMVSRSGRWVKRPAMTTDSISTVTGLMLWDDNANRVQRLVARYDTGAAVNVKVKDTSGDGYGSAIVEAGALRTGYASSYTNYKGLLYYCVTNGVAANALPAALFSCDGTAITGSPLGGESLYSLTITSFIDRLFLGYVRASVENKLGTSVAYDPTQWSNVTTTCTTITNGSSIIGRITPTATTNSQIYEADVYTVAASTSDTTLFFLSQLRGTSPTYDMPVTCEIYYSQAWVADTAMAVGAIRVPTTLNGYRYRVTAVAGDTKTHATVEPTWPTTIGTTVVDDQVTWICDGKEAIASTPATIPSLTTEQKFTDVWTRAVIPPMPASAKVGVRIKFGTTAVGTIELAPLDMSLRDGLTDGDLKKANKGQQLTVGKFSYPFFNAESSATSTLDLDNDIYWTDPSDPNTIKGDYYYRLLDVPGKVTAMTTVGGRLIVFKRRGMWVFQANPSDPDNPITLERFMKDYGCIGPRAYATYEDTLYFIGENEVYAYRPGGEPEPLCGNAIREEMFNKGTSNWVENSGSNFKAVATAAVNPQTRELIVNTQQAVVHVLQLDRKEWSRWVAYVLGTPNAPTNCNLFVWNPNTSQLYLAKSTALCKMASTAADDLLLSTDATIILRPLETLFPNSEMLLERIRIHHTTTGTQAAGSLTVYVSLNGGSTYAKSHAITLPVSTAADVKVITPVTLRQRGHSLVIKLVHTGNMGETMFAPSMIEADVRVLRNNRTLANPTSGSATL